MHMPPDEQRRLLGCWERDDKMNLNQGIAVKCDEAASELSGQAASGESETDEARKFAWGVPTPDFHITKLARALAFFQGVWIFLIYIQWLAYIQMRPNVRPHLVIFLFSVRAPVGRLNIADSHLLYWSRARGNHRSNRSA